MWQIRLLFFVKAELAPFVSNIDYSKEATGVGRVMANKGGVAISFNFFEARFCFVNTHLAAHQENIKDRNRDVKEVIDEMSLTNVSGISLNVCNCRYFNTI